MNHTDVVLQIARLLNENDISADIGVGTFSTHWEVKKGPTIVGDFDSSDVLRIKTYLKLADYFPRITLTKDGDELVMAGDGNLVGYVGDYDGEIDYKF